MIITDEKVCSDCCPTEPYEKTIEDKVDKKIFPDCYPSNLYEKIIEDGAKENTFSAYRVSNYNVINKDTFLSSFEEFCLESGNNINRDLYYAYLDGMQNIGNFSVSFFEEKKNAEMILKLKKKYHDGPILIYGNILPQYGLSMRTCDSKSHRKAKKSHIDLWKYKDIDPSATFSKVEVI